MTQDTPESLILSAWGSAGTLNGLLDSSNVYNEAPEDPDTDPPYVCINLDVDTFGAESNSGGGVAEGTLIVQVFHENWKLGSDILKEFKKTFHRADFDGEDVAITDLRFDSYDKPEKSDGVWEFVHYYSIKVQ